MALARAPQWPAPRLQRREAAETQVRIELGHRLPLYQHHLCLQHAPHSHLLPLQQGPAPAAVPIPAVPTTSTASSTTHHAHREPESGPYRDEDVLLSLQLLAYLSKYPHVRQAFYKPRVTFHPASVGVGGARFGVGSGSANGKAKEKEREKGEREKDKSSVRDGFFKSFGASRASASKASTSASAITAAPMVQPSPSGSAGGGNGAPSSARQTNVFSLVERFTFKPSSSEGEGSSGAGVPPRLPPEIQYWAGVIMRNACRKDDSRGGIRQCANSEYSLTFALFCFAVVCCYGYPNSNFLVMCGKWETYPREFAKCRRCRKPSTVEKSARAQHGVRGTGSGAPQRTWTRTARLEPMAQLAKATPLPTSLSRPPPPPTLLSRAQAQAACNPPLEPPLRTLAPSASASATACSMDLRATCIP